MAAKLDIVIPAAGLGRRMKSYGPKALVSLGQETVLARQVRLLTDAYPRSRILVVAGFESERVRRHLPAGVRMVVNPDYESCNVASSVSVGLRQLGANRPTLIVYGDLVFPTSFVADLPLDRSSAVVTEGYGREEEVGANVVGGLVTRFAFGLKAKWGHVCVLTPADRDLFVSIASLPSRRKHFGYEVLNDVIDGGADLHAVLRDGTGVCEIDTSRDIEAARRVAC